MPTAAPDLEALRRRLYSPAATDADRAAYRASAPQAPQVELPPEDAPRSQRTGSLLVAVAVAAAAALAAAAVSAVSTAGRAAPTAAALHSSPAAGAPVLVAAATAVPVGSAARAEFTAAVAAGVTPDVRGWFAEHPGELPVALAAAADVAASVHDGRGPAAIDVLPPVAWRARTLTVLIVTDHDAAVTWTAERSILNGDDSRRLQPVAASVAAVRAGVPSVASAALTMSVPGHLVLHVAAGTRWSAGIVYSDDGPDARSGAGTTGSAGAVAE